MNTHRILAEIVDRVKCKPGWGFRLVREDDGFLKLVITVAGRNSDYPDRDILIAVQHWRPVPEATYNEKSWTRWLFDQCLAVENHEVGEWFRLDGNQPFRPLHAPGEDPYTVHEYRDLADARILQDGSMEPPCPHGRPNRRACPDCD